jgi:hypothetical protein
MHAPQSMHLEASNLTIFPRVNASEGQASTQPSQVLLAELLQLQLLLPLPQSELVHLPSFQQHFL